MDSETEVSIMLDVVSCHQVTHCGGGAQSRTWTCFEGVLLGLKARRVEDPRTEGQPLRVLIL